MVHHNTGHGVEFACATRSSFSECATPRLSRRPNNFSEGIFMMMLIRPLLDLPCAISPTQRTARKSISNLHTHGGQCRASRQLGHSTGL